MHYYSQVRTVSQIRNPFRFNYRIEMGLVGLTLLWANSPLTGLFAGRYIPPHLRNKDPSKNGKRGQCWAKCLWFWEDTKKVKLILCLQQGMPSLDVREATLWHLPPTVRGTYLITSVFISSSSVQTCHSFCWILTIWHAILDFSPRLSKRIVPNDTSTCQTTNLRF